MILFERITVVVFFVLKKRILRGFLIDKIYNKGHLITRGVTVQLDIRSKMLPIMFFGV